MVSVQFDVSFLDDLRIPWARRRFAIRYRDKEKLTRAAALLVDYLAVFGR